jgi:hypothetical protein
MDVDVGDTLPSEALADDRAVVAPMIVSVFSP